MTMAVNSAGCRYILILSTADCLGNDFVATAQLGQLKRFLLMSSVPLTACILILLCHNFIFAQKKNTGVTRDYTGYLSQAD